MTASTLTVLCDQESRMPCKALSSTLKSGGISKAHKRGSPGFEAHQKHSLLFPLNTGDQTLGLFYVGQVCSVSAHKCLRLCMKQSSQMKVMANFFLVKPITIVCYHFYLFTCFIIYYILMEKEYTVLGFVSLTKICPLCYF